MAADDHAAKVADEQARNRRYVQSLRDKGDRMIPIAVHASSTWTLNGLPKTPAPEVHAVIGRVGLTGRCEDIGGDCFYIGPSHLETDDITVFSWAAPVAHAFFGTGGYPALDGKVQVTRAFRHKITDIVDFDDERVDGGHGPTAFDHVTRLAVPRPPRPRPATDSTVTTAPDPTAAPTAAPAPAVPSATKPASAARTDTGPPPRLPDEPVARPGLRHEAALRKALAAPRTGSLGHVLGTMQPRQYELVTWPEDVPLVVQGFPGSGKTIVALHRAAYLVNPERKAGRRPHSVVLLGPTTSYVRHTRRAVQSLADTSSVTVLSIPDLLRRIYPRLSNDSEATSEQYQDNARLLARLVDRATALVDHHGGLRGVPPEVAAQRIYDSLRALGTARTTRIDSRWCDYLAALPDWPQARRRPRLHSLVAYCYLNSSPTVPAIVDHLVVDEAQDVTPLVWHLLRRLNRAGRWTIVGDMNQRSFDWSLPAWDDITDAAGINMSGRPVEEFRETYRSTQGILTYANRLLPRQADVHAIQHDDNAPSVLKYTANDLPHGIVAAVDSLHERHPHGTLAVISVDESQLRQAFARAGWQAHATESDIWMRDNTSVRLLHAQEARGLEFDAVVVVEPALFPQSDGTEGPLYTSLTRANRELVIVHSRRLPEQLAATSPRRRRTI